MTDGSDEEIDTMGDGISGGNLANRKSKRRTALGAKWQHLKQKVKKSESKQHGDQLPPKQQQCSTSATGLASAAEIMGFSDDESDGADLRGPGPRRAAEG